MVVLFSLLAAVTFYQDVEPILRKHCVVCHQRGELGPMPLVTYKDVRPRAAAIREAVKLRRMPPWFADPKHGEFANDPRLSEDEIRLIDAWAASGAPAGEPRTRQTLSAPQRVKPDLLLTAPPVRIPAGAEIDYQYAVLPLNLTEDRWVRATEILPGSRAVVHHAVLYVREAGSQWLREAPPNQPYSPGRDDDEVFRRSRDTKADILAVYTPGAPATIAPDGMARKLPAGADLVLQMHYTAARHPVVDRTRVALSFLRSPPSKRIITLQMGRDDLRIPPGEPNYRATVAGTLPADALLLAMFPHLHLRGAAFEYDLVQPGGRVETLLRVKPYNFNWQLNYVLRSPRFLPKGTMLRLTGYFDNSPNNPFNPDPDAEVRWGEQSTSEMMIGFFDVAVDPHIDKQQFFSNRKQ